MTLRPPTVDDVRRAAEWLSRAENYRWLDFGPGQTTLTAVTLRMMAQKPACHLRVFTSDDDDERAIGLVALIATDAPRKTATLWYLLGEKEFAGRGLTRRAVLAALDEGFGRLGLRTVHTWVADGNAASIRILERCGFRLVGRLREAHTIDGAPCDRILFELLAREHRSDGT